MCKPQLYLLISVAYLFAAIYAKETQISQLNGWKNEKQKCASGGEGSHTSTYRIGDMKALGLEINDIDSQTVIVALGHFNLYTRSEQQVRDELVLSQFTEHGNYKEFVQEIGIKTKIGWSTQSAKITLTVKFSNGAIFLVNTVTTNSWGAISCAETKAYIDKISIMTNDRNTKNNNGNAQDDPEQNTV